MASMLLYPSQHQQEEYVVWYVRCVYIFTLRTMTEAYVRCIPLHRGLWVGIARHVRWCACYKIRPGVVGDPGTFRTLHVVRSFLT